MSEMRYFSISEFARRTGVTVRTLRYYDQTGLLKPSAYSESGRRLYVEADYARMQQILTLKLIGLSLAEIKSLLTTDMVGIQTLMERQKQVLGEQVRQLKQVIRAIEQAQWALDNTQSQNIEAFIHIIKAVSMNNQANWFDQFFTEEQRQHLAESSVQQSYQEQKKQAEAWKKLFTDIREHLDTGQEDLNTQDLVSRWHDLMAQYTGGDSDLTLQLNQAYTHLADLDSTPQSVQEWLGEVQAAAAFIVSRFAE
ncbi:MAG: MerR family transcriptional regulator [Anaerolineaceae bacterium]|nr:MerR family transcriptional regulator [Anaerolineaceae bacterium]